MDAGVCGLEGYKQTQLRPTRQCVTSPCLQSDACSPCRQQDTFVAMAKPCCPPPHPTRTAHLAAAHHLGLAQLLHRHQLAGGAVAADAYLAKRALEGEQGRGRQAGRGSCIARGSSAAVVRHGEQGPRPSTLPTSSAAAAAMLPRPNPTQTVPLQLPPSHLANQLERLKVVHAQALALQAAVLALPSFVLRQRRRPLLLAQLRVRLQLLLQCGAPKGQCVEAWAVWDDVCGGCGQVPVSRGWLGG